MLISAVIVALVMHAQSPQPAVPAAPVKPFDCTAPEYRQFDFWVGTWDVRRTNPAPPPPGTTSTPRKPATNTIERAHNGCVVIENWEDGTGGTGQSFNLYDRVSQRWHQTWVDSGGGLHKYWGGLKDGNMVLVGEVPLPPTALFQGRRTLRVTFMPMGPDKMRQFSESLNSDGTWTTNYDLTYTRRASQEVTITADSPRHHIDVVVFASPLVRVGRWRCPAEHPHFVDSGPSSDALFAFPREGVWIEHEGRDPFVADANTVTYYNKGQCYRRRKLSLRGDQCEWFAVSPDAIAETLSGYEAAAIDRPRAPFPFSRGPSDPDSYLRQRLVFHHVSSEQNPDRLFVEEAVLSVLGDVTRLAYLHSGAAAVHRRARRRDIDVVEAARDVIARQFTANLSLSDIAGAVGSSVFHLARMFKSRTGFSLHAYRNQLRLRAALDQLRDSSADLTHIALELGFSSHSHFTETFRRSFGKTPSAVRQSL